MEQRLPEDFRSSSACAREEGSSGKHLSDLTNHSLCSYLRIFFFPVSFLILFLNMVASAEWAPQEFNDGRF